MIETRVMKNNQMLRATRPDLSLKAVVETFIKEAGYDGIDGSPLLEKRIVIHFGEDCQLAANGGIEKFTSCLLISSARHDISNFRGIKVR